ncbi:MAG: sulfatase-like hydrolase/transferase [Phycisphaera sp.]|nr:sulfatase-like hydrolase/transferase [Phycisphaera sp.]
MYHPTKLFAIAFTTVMLAALAHAEPPRPNALVIMVDDLGYSDLGCYGSEIDTPNLDALAAEGVRFSQFYNTAKCHSSRVSLLTGQYCKAAGDTSLTNAVTSAELLRKAGYFTAMTGKWHLKDQPTDHGFDRYFGHLSGATNYFSGDNTFRLNGEPWKVPDKGFYTTVADVDYALKFLGEARQTDKPWYLYVAFNAPHAPLQALAEDFAKYEHRYDVGWDAIRDARLAKQKKLGLLPESLVPSPRPEHIPAWDTLSPARRAWEAKRMATFAAMIDRVDQEVGRLFADLRAHHEMDNTLIVFVSDNGACPYDRRSRGVDEKPINAGVGFSDSTGWAWVSNSPFRYYKQNQYEGGVSTPGIVHWPDGAKAMAGQVCRTPAHLIDVWPTLAEVAGASEPSEWQDRDLHPVSGRSLVPLLRGQPLNRGEPIHLMFAKDRGLRDGDWKIVSFRGEAWELYNVARDRTELHDLAAQEPERLKSMVNKWTEMTRDVLHAPAHDYEPVGPARLPHKHPEWTDFSKEPGVSGKKQRAEKSDK